MTQSKAPPRWSDSADASTEALASLATVDRVRRLKLRFTAGPNAGSVVATAGAETTVGSADGNDVVIADRTVSRFHAAVRVVDGAPHLVDLGSKNGTFVGDARVLQAILRDGDVVSVGASTFVVELGVETSDVPLYEGTTFGSLVGRSRAARAMFVLLEKAARSDVTVLLSGETGTGKGAAAEAIHEASARRGGAFEVVDCGAISPTLVESELFGHERGAFTGATERTAGAFERASGGTLFLDEIGEMPLDLQPKLLRVLESRTVRRVGGDKPFPVDVRVIAATNRDLREEVNAGRFRADLYFRLAVVNVRVPSLRDRAEDIPELALRLLKGMGLDDRAAAEVLTAPTVARLRRHAWPGNVRELRNHLESLRILGASSLRECAALPEVPDLDELAALPFAEARRIALDRFEGAYLTRLLARCKGNVSKAAREAGVHRVHFHRLLRRMNVTGN